MKSLHAASVAGILATGFFVPGRGNQASSSAPGGAGASVAPSGPESLAVAAADSLLHLPSAPESFGDRLEFFSRALEGRPYFPGPTGEGRFGRVDTMPLVDLERFDCVTYMESAMALALSRSARDFLPELLRIRYRSDSVSFSTRNHFFVEDWLKNNAGLVAAMRLPGDTTVEKTLDKKEFFRKKNIPGPESNPVARIIYLPYDRTLALARDWDRGKALLGVALVSQRAGLDVFHTGFLLAGEGPRPRLRHAGARAGKVVTEDFYDYLLNLEGELPGVAFFEFREPEGGR